jgi:hypothetical protein
MGTYRTAEVCPNGHVSTESADVHPELREKFCSQCGEPTMTTCPGCNASIRGDYHVSGAFFLGGSFEPPAHCHNCGKAFPWTERKIAGAVELLEADGKLSADEIVQVRSDLVEMTKNTPRLQAASMRFKKSMTKAGAVVASGVRDIVVDVLSEAAKKALWPS